MLTVVTMREIEQVFEILADLGVSREAVTIPLKPAHPGGVRLLPDHRLEIVLDSQAPLADTLERVRAAIEAILASPAGAAVQRDD
ncbi:MAG: hypothetical protein SF182_20715 [Deltaproteobacteria bacterium]|nr:hypothetical protein [Deltaproteobacteria bacterium]